MEAARQLALLTCDTETRIKGIIGRLSQGNVASDLTVLHAALDACKELETQLQDILAAAADSPGESADDKARWETARRNRDAAVALQTHMAKFGFIPRMFLPTSEPVSLNSNIITTTAPNLNLIPKPNIIETPKKPQPLSSAQFAFETPGGQTLGGLVGSNEFEDLSLMERDNDMRGDIGRLSSIQNEQFLFAETPGRMAEVAESSSDSDEDDMSHMMIRGGGGGGGVGIMEETCLVDPPSPTLESLGISSFGMGLLNLGSTLPPSSLDTVSPQSTPIAHRLTALRFSTGSSNDALKSSPSIPEITPTPIHHSVSDSNSIFGDLIRNARMDEYEKISTLMKAQISFEYLNEAITEINEYVTDKRFQGMGEDEDQTECLTMDELMSAGTLEFRGGNVKQVMFVTRRNCNLNDLTMSMAGLCAKRGVRALVGTEIPISDSIGDKVKHWNPEFCHSHGAEVDLVVTLGGDGTVLYTSSLFQNRVPPIVPFHLGSLGFLTVFDHATYETVLHDILDGRPKHVNMRMRLQADVYYRGAGAVDRGEDVFDSLGDHVFSRKVLNEVVVHRGGNGLANLEF
ncbi:NAD(+) kinase [Podochytrium sp. JEL0797]|nr:NAD(+) kinase [Podochytrium sp. JEL0797]